MTENEYVAVTNLAKLRTVDTVLRDILPTNDGHKAVIATMLELCDALATEARESFRVRA